MSRSAITPSDAGASPAGVAIGPTVADCIERFTPPAQHPVNVANRERSMRQMNAAIAFADAAAKLFIEYCADADFLDDGPVWYDTSNCAGNGDLSRYVKACEFAAQYIEMRDPDAFPFRFIRHPDQPHLVRFEDKP